MYFLPNPQEGLRFTRRDSLDAVLSKLITPYIVSRNLPTIRRVGPPKHKGNNNKHGGGQAAAAAAAVPLRVGHPNTATSEDPNCITEGHLPRCIASRGIARWPRRIIDHSRARERKDKINKTLRISRTQRPTLLAGVDGGTTNFQFPCKSTWMTHHKDTDCGITMVLPLIAQ